MFTMGRARFCLGITLAAFVAVFSTSAYAGTLGTESSDFSPSYTDPLFTVSSAGANTVTGSIGPSPTDTYDAFSVKIPSSLQVTSISYSGPATDGYGAAMNFTIGGCGFSSRNQTLSTPASNCTINWTFGADFQTSSGAWTVTINTQVPPNTAPTASSFTASSGPYEGVAYTFTTSNFGYSDADGDTLSLIRITSLPSAGTLYVDANNNDSYDSGEALGTNGTVSKANLDSGNLQYIQNGSSNTSFSFDVNDGTDYSSSTYTATLKIIAKPAVTLSVNPTSRTESVATNTPVTATLSHTFGAPVTVNLAFSGTATNSTDYTRSGSAITIGAGSSSGSINLANVDDGIHENNETVVTDIASVTNGFESGTQQVTYTIIDDDSLPTVSNVAVPAAGSYKAGQNLDFTVNTSANVTVNTSGGTPQLSLTVGSTTRQASYVSGSGTSALLFRYTVQSGDSDSDGIAVGALSANGGTLKDGSGNDLDTTLNSVGSTSAVLVDAVAPTVTSVSVPANSTYGVGQNLDFNVNTSESVIVNTAGGVPQLALTIGSSTHQASYLSGSGTSSLLFRYTVQSGDSDSDGIAVGALSANGGTLTDGSGNALNTSLNSLASTVGVLVDGIAPTVSSVTVPANGTYVAGQNLDFTVNASENLDVNTTGGTPQLSLTIGAMTRQASYLSGSGTGTLLFRYTVQAGDSDADGIAIGSLSANGGSLTDSAGNALNSTLNSVGSTTGVLVDAVAPTVTSVSVPANATYAPGQNLDFTVNASESITVAGGVPQLSLTIGSTTRQASYLSGSGTSALLFRYTVQTGDNDSNGISVGSLVPNGGTLSDASGNALNTTLNSIGNTSAVLVDGVAPTVTSVSVPSNATYITGQNLDFTVNTSESVTVAGGTPQLSLTIGATVRQAVYISGSGSSALLFRYTVQSGDMDSDGVAVGSLSANGASLADAVGNTMVTTLNNVGSTSNVRVDAVPPTISSVTVPANGTYKPGDVLNFSLNSSENVVVNTAGGTPQLSLTVGSTTRQGSYVSGSGSSTLLFRYTVQSGDLDTDGIVVGSLTANGGTLKDVAGNSLDGTLNSVGSTSAVLVDGVPPSVTAIALVGTPASNASSVSYTVKFNEAASNISSDDFLVTNVSGNASGVVSGVSAATGSTVTVTVGNLYGTGAVRLDLKAGTNIADAVGNTGVAAFTTGESHTVSRLPSITSANYDVSTGTLVVTGQNFSALAGAANDIDASKFSFSGEANSGSAPQGSFSYASPYALAGTANVEITSDTQFTIQVNAAEQSKVSGLLTANGSAAANNTPYNLVVADNWLAAAPAALDISDGSNPVNVSNALTLSVSGTDTSKLAGKDGTATATVAGGVPSPSYLWSTGATTKAISNLVAGNYSFGVQDSVGTRRAASVSIADPSNHSGQVSISGSAIVGQTLTAVVSDPDGVSGKITYLWQSGGASVGSDSASYVVQASDQGNSLTVTVTYTDDIGYAENHTSAATAGVVTVKQNALNVISATAAKSGSTPPTLDDYNNAGVNGVTQKILALINRAVSRQSASGDVDQTTEIQALLDVILEGQDSDGDGLPNIFEGDSNKDTDGDGIADRDDTDADNDGIDDKLELAAIAGDSDNDGILDAFDADVGNDDVDGTDPGKTDANFDGVNDDVDTVEKLVKLFSANQDGDQYPDSVDADADGDGVTDSGVTDSNNDGIIDGKEDVAAVLSTLMKIDPDRDAVINSLDLDSDNDSLTDVSESGLMDRNNDGFIDDGDTVITDANKLLDTNADGVPNFLQLSSDGITDDILSGPHSGEASTLDANNDGRLDDATDSDGDGVPDSIDGLVGFGINGDLDSDGIPDSQDLRVSTSPDVKQSGSSGGSVSWWLLLPLLMLGLSRQRAVRGKSLS